MSKPTTNSKQGLDSTRMQIDFDSNPISSVPSFLRFLPPSIPPSFLSSFLFVCPCISRKLSRTSGQVWGAAAEAHWLQHDYFLQIAITNKCTGPVIWETYENQVRTNLAKSHVPTTSCKSSLEASTKNVPENIPANFVTGLKQAFPKNVPDFFPKNDL